MRQKFLNTMLAMFIVAALSVTSQAMGAAFTANPSLASAGSTEVVELVGSGATVFTGATAVGTTVGGTAVTNLLVVDPTHIVMTVPAKSKGSYTISVNSGTPVSVANAIVYTQANRTLQVSMNIVIAKNITMFWASGTSQDDIQLTTQGGSLHGTTPANSLTPYTWWLRDAEFGLSGVNATVNLAAVYSTDGTGGTNGDGFAADPTNAHTILVGTSALTSGAPVQIDAMVSDDTPAPAGAVNWTAAGAAGPNQYLVQACLGTGAQGSTGTKPLVVSPVANLVAAGSTVVPAGMVFNLQVSTPLTSTSALATQHTITVSLIATSN